MSRRLALSACIALLMLSHASAADFTVEALVGQWFTELEEKSTFNGEPYTIRKQVEDNRADGTKSVTFRFYDNCRYIGESIQNFQWGVRRGAYWARCRTVVEQGIAVPCDGEQVHDIVTATDKKLEYRSRDSGRLYSHTRVDAAFKIPPSSCVSEAPQRGQPGRAS